MGCLGIKYSQLKQVFFSVLPEHHKEPQCFHVAVPVMETKSIYCQNRITLKSTFVVQKNAKAATLLSRPYVHKDLDSSRSVVLPDNYVVLAKEFTGGADFSYGQNRLILYFLRWQRHTLQKKKAKQVSSSHTCFHIYHFRYINRQDVPQKVPLGLLQTRGAQPMAHNLKPWKCVHALVWRVFKLRSRSNGLMTDLPECMELEVEEAGATKADSSSVAPAPVPGGAIPSALCLGPLGG